MAIRKSQKLQEKYMKDDLSRIKIKVNLQT